MKKILLTLSLITICSTQINFKLKADAAPTQADLSDFANAIKKGDLSKVTEILEKYQNNSKHHNTIANHPLKCGERYFNNYIDSSPLLCTIKFGTKSVNDIVKVLIKYGANVNEKTRTMVPQTAMDFVIANRSINKPDAESIRTTLKNAGAKTGAELEAEFAESNKQVGIRIS